MPAPAPVNSPDQRIPRNKLGLYGATMVGVSAMLGAGIFVLSGVALEQAGPGAVLAFAFSGVIVILTAFSFAELASAFPESGGSYVFARKVFPIGGAFAAGWTLWLAYLLAAALYGLGFASFLGFTIELLAERFGFRLEFQEPWFGLGVAAAVLVMSARMLTRRGAGAGSAISLAKLFAFLILIVPGLYLVFASPAGTIERGFSPLFPTEQGFVGVFVAMGYTFIALEGFEVIAAIAEDVDKPSETIPRAMFLSIGITLVVYLLLLFVMITSGGASGPAALPAWQDLAQHGDLAVAIASERILGTFGELVVLIAGLLATFTALNAALMAASRVSLSMSRDRALPRSLSHVDEATGTPGPALRVSTALTLVLVAVMGSVEIAGAAASLIFLVFFAMANGAGLLVRKRGGKLGGYQAPLFPVLPLLGAAACLALAVFQFVQVPVAALVALVWLITGGVLYRVHFRRRAETVSARAESLDSMLIRLRGREPLVLIPLANPERAETLVRFANALVPRRFGHLLAMTVAVPDIEDGVERGVSALGRAQAAMRKALETACALGCALDRRQVEGPDVADAVGKVVAECKPEIVLLGMSRLDVSGGTRLLESVIEAAEVDVVVVNAPPTWTPDAVKRILVPVAGSGSHDPLRARVIGMFQRLGDVQVTVMRVVRRRNEQRKANELLREAIEDLGSDQHTSEVLVSAEPIDTLIERSKDFDLIVLGLGRDADRRRLVGEVARKIAAEASCPLVAIARAK